MTTKAKSAGRGDVNYHILLVIAGRAGTQVEVHTSKRGPIRTAKNLLGSTTTPQPFGSAVSVTMVDARGVRGHSTLIFQAHVAMKKDGKLFIRSDEL